MLKIFKKKKIIKAPSFFDYSSREKKQIMKQAAQKANKMQLDLVRRYNGLSAT